VRKLTRPVLRGGNGGNVISLTRPHKRRLRYGTLICDLERGQPIDLLPDREVSTVEAWLKKHPSIDVVSRDGSSEYAAAMRKGAPQARQVSDRWHLVKNLAACVSVQLAKTLAQLRRAEERRPAQTQAVQQAQQARQAERMARYEHILELQNQGMKSGEMARTLGMSQSELFNGGSRLETSPTLAGNANEHVSLILTRPTS